MHTRNKLQNFSVLRGGWLLLALLGGIGLLGLCLSGLVLADPIDPPQGYPKLSLSMKTVSPTLASPGGVTLTYAIEIRNTGAYTADGVVLTDVLSGAMTYNGDAWAETGAVTYTDRVLHWEGDVGFDATVLLTFSVTLDEAYSGTLVNTAVISQATLAEAVAVTAETVVTDRPILAIEKSAEPAKPGANKPLVYTLNVYNWGQPAQDLPITVTDYVPVSTTLHSIGMSGFTSAVSDVVTWTRSVSLGIGDFETFTFTVEVGDVPPDTAIVNQMYAVASTETAPVQGEPYTVTIVAPELRLTKRVMPDPPGSNREMMYTLRLFNGGSLATDLVITDVVPSGVTYQDGGSEADGVVSWTLASLDTAEFALFTYTVYVSDVLHVPVANVTYEACCAEGVCAVGEPVTSEVEGPIFKVDAWMEPIAKRPGGGSNPDLLVTPTVVIRNLGPGNAIDAMAIIKFANVSIANRDDLMWSSGTLGNRYPCGEYRCFDWTGSLGVGENVTFTVTDPKSTMGGAEGNLYTVTAVITDILRGRVTDPVSDTAIGKITHLAYLRPIKSAPTVIGRGQRMTYTLDVQNTALSTDVPPYPVLYDFLPMSMTVITISHGGMYHEITGSMTMRMISWTLPALSTGEVLAEPRWFVVEIDQDVVSGTHLVNDYMTKWYENDATYTGWLSATGKPFTTTVIDVGLIDSYKAVTPTLLSPGEGNVLTYILHIKNSSAVPLANVKVYDTLPWQMSTYQRDAVATSGSIVSDIVSLTWMGDVGPLGEELITLTAVVDPFYEGPVTNTAVITHADLLKPVEVEETAYVTTKPVLNIRKTDSPDPVQVGGEILYTIRVSNLGQQANHLVITDVLPANVTLDAVFDSGSYDDVSREVRWEPSDLSAGGGSETFSFRVTADSGREVVNDDYAVSCAEGVVAFGDEVITTIEGGEALIYLPLVLRETL